MPLTHRQTILSPFEQKMQKQIQEKASQKTAAKRILYEKDKLARRTGTAERKAKQVKENKS
jgi:hypothetical protein